MCPPETDRFADAPPVPSNGSRTDASAETLAKARTRILAMFRTRRELIRWNAVSEYVDDAYAGVHELRAAAGNFGSAALIPTTEKAIAIVVKLLLHADDSNGEIQGVVGALLHLHAELCKATPPKPAVLAEWLIDFRFGGAQGFFEPDIAQYRDALGEPGLTVLSERLDALEAELPPPTDAYDSKRRLIASYRQRVAVASGDPEKVIASFGDLTRSYLLHDLAQALMEIGAIDQAIAYAERAALLEESWQAERAGHYWAELLHEYRAHDAELAARQMLFDRRPSAKNALALAQAAGAPNSAVTWDSFAEAVFERLETQHPRELIGTLLELDLTERAWEAGERLTTDVGLWTELVAAREKADPAAVVPVLIQLIQSDLAVSKPQNYKSAVGRLRQLRRALKATNDAHRFALLMVELRDENSRRPTLLQAFDRAGF
jgi:tetratricopeptide (TPR) repeat protein